MSIFPQIDTSIEIGTTENDTIQDAGKELLFDFKKGDFIMKNGAPVMVEGKEALMIWIEKTIRTARYRYLIYSFDYGCELEDLIGLSLPRKVLESEMKRVIYEALIIDDRINDIRDFEVKQQDSTVHVKFTVDSIYDEFQQEVSIGV